MTPSDDAGSVPGQEFYDDGNSMEIDQGDPFRTHRGCAMTAAGTYHSSHDWVYYGGTDPKEVYCAGLYPDHSVTREEAYAAMRDRIKARLREEEARQRCEKTTPHHPHKDCIGVGGEVVRWADRAMFKAEPIVADEGPKVYLLWMTPDPLGAIAAACKMYKGEVVRDLATVTDDERLEYFQQVQKTKLKAPFEFVNFHFLIEGVTRAFTHQMVRQRTAVYAQESLRFAVVGEDDGNIPVRLPPSLSGLPEDDSARLLWEQNIADIGAGYRNLVDMGVPAEDARGLLPHNVLTRLHYSTDLRALLDHAGNRLCTQAQFEWRLVFSKIVEAIRDFPQNAPFNTGESDEWQCETLSGIFKPVCYQTGKCEFKANFDRSCSIRERVDANEKIGRPSSEWDREADLGSTEYWRPGPMLPWVQDGRDIIPAIKPGEWLLDPGAARQR